MDFQTVIYEKEDGIATITLNRPEKLHALNWRMNAELQYCWNDIKKDPAVVVAIVTATGDRALCTGFDMGSAGGGEEVPKEFTEDKSHVELLFTAIQNKCWKPVITAVNGMVVGGGLHFMADSDLIIAAEHATFFDTHVQVGLASVTEPISLARRMPLEPILRMAFLGSAERMSAQRAYELGLVGEIVPRERLMERARETARAILKNSPQALIASKKAIWGSLDYGLRDGLEYGWEILNAHRNSPDQREGPRAFMEKRKPDWAPAVVED